MNEQTPNSSRSITTVGTPLRSRMHPAAVVLAAGFALYMFVQVGLILGPIVARPVPPGTTDAYVYIAKAEQLRACPRQRCPALADLHRQVELSAGLSQKVARQRTLTHQRALLQYHILHSVALAGMRSLGVNYSLAINILSVAGAILIACAVTWLLYAAFGPGPAGMALALLAFGVYPGYHGLHWIVPSTLTLGLAMLSWAAAIARPRGLAALLPLLILAMVWMHPIGRIYAAATLVLYAALVAWNDRRGWIVVALGLVALASPILAGYFIDRPALAYLGLHDDGSSELRAGIERNLRSAWWAVRPWLVERGGAAVLALAVLGLAIAESGRRRALLVLGGLVLGLVVASLAYILPRYPAELFQRIFVPFAIVATGLAGYAAWRSVALFVVPRDEGGGRGFGARMRSTMGLFVRIIGLALVAVATVLAALGTATNGGRAVLSTARYMTAWGMMPLDTGQPARVLAGLPKDARIVYFDDLSFFFYASNGSLTRGAVFNPAVTGSDLAKRYYSAAGRVALSVRARDGFYGYVELRRGRHVVIRAKEPVDWSRVRVNLTARGAGMSLDVRVLGAGAPVRVRAEVDASGWRTLGLPAGSTGRALILSRNDTGPLGWLGGLRLTREARRTWPWDKGVTIVQWKVAASVAQVMALARSGAAWPSRPKTLAVHSFETWTLAPAGCRHIAVVEDFGATVASRIACGEPGPARRQGSPKRE